MKINLKIINSKIKNYLPKYATKGSSGIDLRACINNPIIVKSNKKKLIPSGFAIHINNINYTALILPRSKLGHFYGIILGNSIGVIDSDYQGEIKISVWNRSSKSFIIKPMERIAQLIIIPIKKINFNIVDKFTLSDRGELGFGSTGKF